MSSDDVVIRAQGLGKCYQIYDTPRDRLKQFLMPSLHRMVGHHAPRKYYREFWALNNVSFEIKKGETVGIIGRNGSGKSTLLQIICGTLSPTNGVVETTGRIAALLELGSGFNPEFTGHENIYMNAALLGLSKEDVDEKFDAIAAFADIGQFIDQPVKSYSSGMALRLAFAVQSQIDPDILIVDEALSVGDARFQAKCFERLRQLKENGTSILLVTHSSEQIVTHCTHAILMDSGLQIETGEPRRVVNRYLDLLFGREKKETIGPAVAMAEAGSSNVEDAYRLSGVEDIFSTRTGYNRHEYRWGDGSAAILDFYLSANGAQYPTAISTGDEITLAVSILFKDALVRPILGITFKTKEGITVYGTNSETSDCVGFKDAGARSSVVEVEVKFKAELAAGDYFISLGVATKQGEDIAPHDRRYDSIHLQVRPDDKFFGLVNLGASINIKNIKI